MQQRLCIGFFIFLCANWAYCQDADRDEDQNVMTYDRRAATLTKELFRDYNHLVRPCGRGSPEGECRPVEVRANMKILSITSVDDEKMQFNMQFLFRQEWHDPRLKHTAKSELALDPNEPHTRIWTPDTFFLQEKDGFKPLSEQPTNQYLIRNDGRVAFSSRLAITLACPMDLRRYPFDEQSCEFQFGSYAHPGDQVLYIWDESRAIEIAPDVRPTTPVFTLGDIQKKRDCTHKWMKGTYSCLKAEAHFKRQVGFAGVMKNFVPSFALVLLSWLAFYLGSDAIGIRGLLGAGCLQFLLIHWSILSLNLPRVAGYRAIDVWFIICVLFVWLSLLQLLLLIRSSSKRSAVSELEMVVLDRHTEEAVSQVKQRASVRADSLSEPVRRMSVVKPARKYTRLVPKDSARGVTTPPSESTVVPMTPTSQYYEEPTGSPKKVSMMDKFRRLSGREKVDVVSRFLFPLLFALFNIVYWAYYKP